MIPVKQQSEEVLSLVADGFSHGIMIWEKLPHLTNSQVTRRLIALEKAGMLVRKSRGVYVLAPGVVVKKPIDQPPSWTQKMNNFFSFRLA